MTMASTSVPPAVQTPPADGDDDSGGPARPPERPQHPARPTIARRLASALRFGNIGAVYVWLLIIVAFSIWQPGTFPTAATARQVLNDNAVTGLVALSVVLPLATRVFDLSIAYTMSLTSVIAAHFMVGNGWSAGPAIALAMAVAVLVGLVNGVVVVVLRVDSFIATLATGSIIQAFISMITNDSDITGVQLLRPPFSDIAQTSVAGITLPVVYLIVAAVVIWFLLGHTSTGRRLYATGFNEDAARLQGVRTNRLRILTLIASSTIAGAAGIVFASAVGSGSPTAGTPYLLTAYAAAFVGATQLIPGRFNAWGTVIAVLLLGTGTAGLGLASAAQWSSSLFTGTVLIAALVITGGRLSLPRRRRRHTAPATAATPPLHERAPAEPDRGTQEPA